ncbi:uncharacterized protein VTP21DRAFT_10385 [Calcarisporiella thermophila]|uniref:uncharacterized protein n=1 Tax=Calcarisporiella thermophila TaxID=911321 RepID=UPI00374245C6
MSYKKEAEDIVCEKAESKVPHVFPSRNSRSDSTSSSNQFSQLVPPAQDGVSLVMPPVLQRRMLAPRFKWFPWFFKRRVVPSKAESEVTERLLCYAREEDQATVFNHYNTDWEGLSQMEARERLNIHGPNILSASKPPGVIVIFLNACWHPFNILITVLAIISAAQLDFQTFTLEMVIVALSVILRFWQELKSNRKAISLKNLVRTRVNVVRRAHDSIKGIAEEIDMEEVVPGDIISISAGDIFPGDVLLLDSKDLFVAQATLTGEFMPVEKCAQMPDKSASLLECPNICLMGTNVVSGYGRGLVLTTGDLTFIATISRDLESKRPLNAFEKGVRRVSYLLIAFMGAMVPFVVLINGLTKSNWREAFFFGLSVAVGLTPAMLPMVVNANLARGSIELSKKKTIVKQLNSVQNLGAMDILCSDKTGTLTQENVVLVKCVDCEGEQSTKVLTWAYLNACFQTGLRNLLDSAIVEFGGQQEFRLEIAAHLAEFSKMDELPFDFVRRRLSVILSAENRVIMVTKGAVEEMMNICNQVSLADGTLVPLTSSKLGQLADMCNAMNEEGYRVLAIATREFKEDRAYSIADETDMTLHGFLAFLDPPKESASAAIKEFKHYSVNVKVLTGDNLPVAKKICQDVEVDTQHVITGPELALIKTPEEFSAVVERTTLFAKLTPLQKKEVVACLKRNGHIVGFLGDGINDALALRESDVGISVDTGTNIAKDAADIIITEKNLQIITEGIIRGRITHANTLKYINMAASSNFGNVFSMLVASAWLPWVPMDPIQILTQNLIYDFSQVAIPWDSVDADYLLTPHHWSAKNLGRFMLFLGPTSSIFDMVTFCLMWFYYGVQSEEKSSIFQTGWFNEGLLSQLLIVHMIRTAKIPFIQSIGSWQLVTASMVCSAVGIALPYTPLGEILQMVHLPINFYGFLVAILFCYCCLTQIMKFIYIRLFKEWL